MTRFVLIQTSHPGNVGSAARAMKVMGFSELVLVRPRYADVLTQQAAISLASSANDILESARIVDTLEEALDGVTFACATAMIPRDFGPPLREPRSLFAELTAPEAQVHKLGLVFGCERFGMSNEDVYRCHAVLSIPTHPDYGSLNLAQAVQLLAYDWRQALGGFAVAARTPDPKLADVQAVRGMLDHLQASLETIGYLDPQVPRKLMPRLTQLFNRVQLSLDEVHIFRGIARAMVEPARPKSRPGSED